MQKLVSTPLLYNHLTEHFHSNECFYSRDLALKFRINIYGALKQDPSDIAEP